MILISRNRYRTSHVPSLLAAAMAPVWLWALPAQADQWAFPDAKTIPSANEAYSFTVIPNRDFGETEIPPLGLLQRIGPEGKQTVWFSELVNRHTPVSALPADNGRWVVTFDDYHYVGGTDNVIVVYDDTGHFKYRRRLEHFLSEERISNLPRL